MNVIILKFRKQYNIYFCLIFLCFLYSFFCPFSPLFYNQHWAINYKFIILYFFSTNCKSIILFMLCTQNLKCSLCAIFKKKKYMAFFLFQYLFIRYYTQYISQFIINLFFLNNFLKRFLQWPYRWNQVMIWPHLTTVIYLGSYKPSPL